MAPAAAILAVLLLGVSALWLGQDALIYFPRPYGPEFERPLPGVERIDYATAAGRQSAWWVAPSADPAAIPDRIWFVFGGNAMLALDWMPHLPPLQAAFPRDGFLLVDYPGYGRNDGKPGRRSMVDTSLAARAALRARLGISDSELVGRQSMLGISLGCAPALELATATGARRVVLLAPFTSLVDMARRTVGWPLCHVARDRFDNRARLAELAASANPPEIEIFHGSADQVIPVEMGRELGRIGGATRFVEVPGAGHGDIVDPAFARLAAEASPAR